MLFIILWILAALPLAATFVVGSARSPAYLTLLPALKLRHACQEDVTAIELLALNVFGLTPDFGANWILNKWLRNDLRVAFKAKIAAMQARNLLDHNVLCLVDDDEGVNGLRGLVEVSIQPATGVTSGLMPLSIDVKRKLDKDKTFRPYISNLVVDPSYRRRGYAQQLINECETISRKWGYEEVFLHVDIGEEPAVALYRKLGYETIAEEPVWKVAFTGVQLRFMRRALASTQKRSVAWPWQSRSQSKI
jgi:ribosomal protein S18 acetylase RimI-like enzyme